jgi:hypothetical protein
VYLSSFCSLTKSNELAPAGNIHLVLSILCQLPLTNRGFHNTQKLRADLSALSDEDLVPGEMPDDSELEDGSETRLRRDTPAGYHYHCRQKHSRFVSTLGQRSTSAPMMLRTSLALKPSLKTRAAWPSRARNKIILVVKTKDSPAGAFKWLPSLTAGSPVRPTA